MNNVCYLCSSDKFKPIYKIKKDVEFRVVKCQNCGLVFLNPRPSEKEISAMYDEDYFHGKGFDTSVNYAAGLKTRKDWEIISLDRLKNIEKFSVKDKILDNGCSFGEFLETAKNCGWRATGVELSKYAAQKARKDLKLDVFNGTLEEAQFPKGSFNVITMIELIEHLPDPIKTLKECNKALKKDGLLVIQTGNIDSLTAKLYGKKWHYFLAGHLIYFSKRTIKKMLEKSGFKIERVYNGDEISFYARSKLFWKSKNVMSLSNCISYGKLILVFFVRKLGFGGMVVYAKK